MRTWLTLGALVGAACHPTVEVPAPDLTPDSTVIFFQPSMERATWTTVDSEGKFAAPQQVLNPDEPWHALSYHCSPDILQMPMTLEVETSAENKPMLPNRLSTFTPDGVWTNVEPPYTELKDDIKNLSWVAPEICDARVGAVKYRLPPIPPGALTDLTAFFSLGEGQEAFVASNEGVAYAIDSAARVKDVDLPGIVASGYLGADDGQFYLLMRSGEILKSDLNFETTRVAGGAPLVPPQAMTGSFESNQLFGSPDGRELMVLTSSGAYVYDGDDEWTMVRTTTITDFMDAVWVAPGEFLVFGGETDNTVHHMRRDGTFLQTWANLGDPIRFSQLGDRLFLSVGGGKSYEYLAGDWKEAFNEGRFISVPTREASTGGLIVATIDIGFLFRASTRFGVYHSELGRLCNESSEESLIDGALLAVAPIAPGVDAYVTARIRMAGLAAPVIGIRSQDIPPRACGYEVIE